MPRWQEAPVIDEPLPAGTVSSGAPAPDAPPPAQADQPQPETPPPQPAPAPAAQPAQPSSPAGEADAPTPAPPQKSSREQLRDLLNDPRTLDEIKAEREEQAKAAERPTGRLNPTVRPLGPDDEAIPAGGTDVTARWQQAPPVEAQEGGVNAFTSTANREIAGFLGAPIDIMQSAASAVGIGENEPIGTQYFQGLMEDVGIDASPTEEQAASRPGRAGGMTGAAATTLLPFGAAGRLSKAGKAGTAAGPAAPQTVTGRVFESVRRGAADRPLRFTAAEMAAAQGAGLAGFEAQRRFPGSPAVETFAEIMGGVTAGGAATLAGKASGSVGRAAGKLSEKLVLPAIGIRAVRRMLGKPVETSTERARARGRVSETMRDPSEGLRALDDPETEGFGLTPAQRIGEPELLSLERSVMDGSAALRQERRDQLAGASQRIRDSLKGLAGEGEATPEDARAYLQDLLDERLRIAAVKADERIAALPDNAGRESANVLARRELERALTNARRQERALWSAVPETAAAQPNSLTAEFQRLVTQTPQAQRSSIPGVARRLLTPDAGGNVPIGNTVREIQGLRSELLEVQRRARADGRSNMARIAGELADAALADIDAVAGASGPLRVARDFSRDLNDRFTRGPVGRLLGFEAAGGPSTAPGLTLESTVGRAGSRAREETDTLLRAMERTGDPEAMRDHIETFLRAGFRAAAIRGGRINPEAANTYLRSREGVLARFPDLRRELEQAAQAGDTVRLAEKAADPDIAAAAIFTRAEPGKEIPRVLAGRNPGARMEKLLSQARRDPTGRAEKGLRAAFIEHITPEGDAFIKGSDLRRALSKKKTKAAITALYTPREQQRLRRIARAAELLEGAISAQPSPEGVASGVEDLMTRGIAGILGARAGRALNTGTIQVPGRLAAMFERLQRNGILNPVRRLLSDAVRDEELFRALFADMASSRREAMVVRRLNAWAAGVLGEDRNEGERP